MIDKLTHSEFLKRFENMKANVDDAENPDNRKDGEHDKISDEEFREIWDEFVVTADDWKSLHPHLPVALQCGSDTYYADLATRLKVEWLPLTLNAEVTHEVLEEAAIELTAYLEDIVSGFGVWNAIRRFHRERYGSWLPFYDCEHADYMPDNVNIEDMKFLIWQSWCRCGRDEGIIYSPFSQAIAAMANMAFNLLADAFEEAPEAVRVADQIDRILHKGDFFQMRDLQGWLVCDNPLTSNRNVYDKLLDAAKNVSERNSDISFDKAFYMLSSSEACSRCVGPEGLPASRYLAEMCQERNCQELAAKLRGQETMPQDVYSIVDYDKKIVTVKDAAGLTYRVDKSSFGSKLDFKKVKGLAVTLVKFGDSWQQNGLCFGIPADPLEKGEKPLRNPRNKKELEHLENIVAANKGRRIYYCKDPEQVGKVLGIPARTDIEDKGKGPEDILLLLSATDGAVLPEGYAAVVKDKDNPFYDKNLPNDVSLELITSGKIPDDIARIMQEKKMLPAYLECHQGKAFGKRLLQDNLRFFIGFYRSCQ